ncbi:MAG: hypothetical protein JXR76_29160 [Deltaproteobacteria bacterium]|nr:hypothetical protein [Deltaproteobacteria bacterium]
MKQTVVVIFFLTFGACNQITGLDDLKFKEKDSNTSAVNSSDDVAVNDSNSDSATAIDTEVPTDSVVATDSDTNTISSDSTDTGTAPDTNSIDSETIDSETADTDDSDTSDVCTPNVSIGLFCEQSNVVSKDDCGTILSEETNCALQSKECVGGACVCPIGWTGDSCLVPVLYVNAAIADDTGHNGRSWPQAYKDLQSALTTASSGAQVEIWVAKGRYVPGSTRNATFQLINNVRLYGGFNGSERLLQERDIVTNKTLLDGDIDGNDSSSSFDMHNENVYHVVTGAEGATIDGFTIRGGNADSSVQPNVAEGGGIYATGVSITVANCTIIENSADFGGALHIRQADGYVRNCHIERNFSQNDGGGIGFGSGNYQIINCTFFNNTAAGDNSYGGHGGAISVAGGSLKIDGCSFLENHAAVGGGLYSRGGSNSILINNSLFTGNDAASSGAISIQIDDPSESAQIESCTVTNNFTDGENNSVYLIGNASISNSIFFENSNQAGTDTQIYGYYSPSKVTVSDSIIEGNCAPDANLICDSTVLNTDPQFVDAVSGDFRLKVTSPAIDAGDNSNVASDELDLAENPRIVDGDGNGTATVDMGAYEFMP